VTSLSTGSGSQYHIIQGDRNKGKLGIRAGLGYREKNFKDAKLLNIKSSGIR
jgi:hypothetical protein